MFVFDSQSGEVFIQNHPISVGFKRFSFTFFHFVQRKLLADLSIFNQLQIYRTHVTKESDFKSVKGVQFPFNLKGFGQFLTGKLHILSFVIGGSLKCTHARL